MIKWHVLWALSSLGLAFGINAQMAPSLTFDAEAPDLGVGSGKLRLEQGASVHEFELVEIRALTQDVDRVFGPTLHVRELLLRSPQQDESSTPDVVLYVDFGSVEGVSIPANARDIGPIRDRELAVLASPVGRPLHSEIRLPGDAEATRIVSGTLSITDAVELPDQDGAAVWRVNGVLALEPAREEGAEALSGDFRARLTWD